MPRADQLYSFGELLVVLVALPCLPNRVEVLATHLLVQHLRA
jgi:hypothetical protein